MATCECGTQKIIRPGNIVDCPNPFCLNGQRHQGKYCTTCGKPPIRVIRHDMRGAEYECEDGHEYRRPN